MRIVLRAIEHGAPRHPRRRAAARVLRASARSTARSATTASTPTATRRSTPSTATASAPAGGSSWRGAIHARLTRSPCPALEPVASSPPPSRSRSGSRSPAAAQARDRAGRQRRVHGDDADRLRRPAAPGPRLAPPARDRQRRGARALRRGRPRRPAAHQLRAAQRRRLPARGAVDGAADRRLGPDRRDGPERGRLHRRLRLGRDGDLAAAQQRERHPPDPPRQRLRRLHRPEPRRTCPATPTPTTPTGRARSRG